VLYAEKSENIFRTGKILEKEQSLSTRNPKGISLSSLDKASLQITLNDFTEISTSPIYIFPSSSILRAKLLASFAVQRKGPIMNMSVIKIILYFIIT
jgi:hypothetical protein